MTADVWSQAADEEQKFQDIRLLAEHFTGSLNLSRLELFSVALHAMGTLQQREKLRNEQGRERPELAYGREELGLRLPKCVLTSL